jgi:hypothetical protein
METLDMPSTVIEWTPDAGDQFCALDGVDCTEFGSCVGVRNGDAFGNCLPAELMAAP